MNSHREKNVMRSIEINIIVNGMLIVIFFFYSLLRKHGTTDSDWSSSVCRLKFVCVYGAS